VHPLNLRRDPIRLLLSSDLWAGTWYLIAYQVTGWVLFAIALTAVTCFATLGFTLVGIPLLIVAGVVIRWSADVERVRLRPFCGDVRASWRPVEGHGLLAQLRARWLNPVTWREVAYLLGLFAPLVTLDFAVLTIWLVFLAAITLPVWYRFPHQTWTPGWTGKGTTGSGHGVQLGYFPHGPNGAGSWGLDVNTLPKAVAVAAVCLILFLLWNYVVVATARAHVFVARALLSEPGDPLKEVKEILRGPGPLSAAEAAGHPAL
jgi:hypothetical protein